MGCLVVILAMFVPRLLIFFVWLLTGWIGAAYQTSLWPLLGVLFMPYTTLAYMAAMLNNNYSVSGLWLVLVVVAVMADLGIWGGGRHSHSRVRRKKA
jgi:hypothetical protein